ncbi:MAG: ShlB/FhaC/HecB family hemolysin secretion/activation protein [Rhodospirillales bacterium]|nr:ShlB/FhaC/HecB family hemolysin secretion/activation protein [Rhodospirillales bacterium]
MRQTILFGPATRRLLLAAVASTALVTGLASVAKAQVPESQTGIAGAGRVQEQFIEQPAAPRLMPQIEVRELKIQGAPEGSDKISFRLDSIAVEGVSAYSDAQITSVFANRLGQTITLTDLYGIAADLTRKYRNDGYILTQVVVPPQTIEGGVARLQVVEGYINKIDVQGEGEEDSALKLIRDYAGQINTNGALNSRDLERALLLINDLPGMSSRAILSPSRNQAGAADLLVLVERKDYDAQISADNFGSRYLGPLQLGASGAVNSLFGINDKISSQLVLAPDPGEGLELAYLSMAYKQPVWRYGTTFELFGSATTTDPGFDLDPFNVKGRSHYFGVTVEHPFVRSRLFNVNGHITLDHRNVTTRNDLEPTREDRIRALRAGGDVEFLDQLLGGFGYNILSVEVSRGLDILGANNSGDTNVSRPAADFTFEKMEAEAQRLQKITPKLNLLMGVKGQWTADALLSSEEFGVGGINYGRGFDPSEIIGDNGVVGKLELQWNTPYEITGLDTYQLFGFFDAGRVWNEDATTSSQKRDSASSAGLGVRAEMLANTKAGFMVAFPLNRDIQTQRDRDPRFYVNLSKSF